MQDQPNFSMEEAMKLAASPKGQALLAMLQQQHGAALESAMAQAQAGNYEQVKQSLSDFLETPAGKALLMQLRG